MPIDTPREAEQPAVHPPKTVNGNARAILYFFYHADNDGADILAAVDTTASTDGNVQKISTAPERGFQTSSWGKRCRLSPKDLDGGHKDMKAAELSSAQELKLEIALVPVSREAGQVAELSSTQDEEPNLSWLTSLSQRFGKQDKSTGKHRRPSVAGSKTSRREQSSLAVTATWSTPPHASPRLSVPPTHS
ncbi:hypothetical protein THAOC_01027 [Thalassiosira oceanica]|uniref:Uncharacterized protein n=1 Tax=Thalassiosira oceanica TaxID=159749 RepID=K0TR46_THAOC|nr:hypothetical protein THAOC_01027 [Thalassiosira oceanica]|eukprot:EJK77162.1 hypothetical protein THAOC_01027 [Thalassiosira oceanica]